MEPVNRDLTDAEARAVVKEVSSIWWIVLVVGILFTGFGVAMLFNVAAAHKTIAIIVGAFLIFDGIVELVNVGRKGGSRVSGFVVGGLLIIGGIVVVAWPSATLLVIAVVWGITIIIGGIARIVGSLTFRGEAWGWVLAFGIAELIVGIAAVVWPHVTGYVILLLIGIDAIIAGVIQIILAFQLKKATERLGIG